MNQEKIEVYEELTGKKIHLLKYKQNMTNSQ